MVHGPRRSRLGPLGLSLLLAGCAGTAATPTAAPPAPRPAFRVVEATLNAAPVTHTGPCPATIRFSGRISAIGGAGTVTYRFVRSDGATGPIQTVAFSGPASRDVTTTWLLGASYEGWEQIVILEPQDLKSNRAGFSLTCP